MTDQIRRASRSVRAKMAEAWRKRRYERAFVSKLADVDSEVAATQVWLELAQKCGYVTEEQTAALRGTYAGILRTVVGMITHPETWVLGYGHSTQSDDTEQDQEERMAG